MAGRQVRVLFQEVLQDTQSYEMFDEREDHFISKIQFDLDVDGKSLGSLEVEVRQPFGTRFENEEFEVADAHIANRVGTWDHGAFSDACANYVRCLIGQGGTGIRIGSGATNIRMRENRFRKSASAEFTIPEDAGGAW